MAEKPSYEELLNRVSTLQAYFDLAGVMLIAINTEGNVTQKNSFSDQAWLNKMSCGMVL